MSYILQLYSPIFNIKLKNKENIILTFNPWLQSKLTAQEIGFRLLGNQLHTDLELETFEKI